MSFLMWSDKNKTITTHAGTYREARLKMDKLLKE